jgi:type III secretory pathway component EscU
MRLVKRLIELALVILVISLFMKNKDVELQLNYFGLKAPLTVAFWELVTFCVSLGIIIAAVGDFVTQFKWVRERRRMIKTDQEHASEVAKLDGKIGELESENRRLSSELEQKTAQVESLQRVKEPFYPPAELPSPKPEETK